MEPPPFGDGNRLARFLQASVWPLCFNGATAFRRWKPLRRRVVARLRIPASMEPPPFGDGNAARTGSLPAPSSCFNGATAFRRWKPLRRRVKIQGRQLLQWSHRLSAMETVATGVMTAAQWALLQWSHRLSAMETRTWASRLGRYLRRFNGATAFRRWKPPTLIVPGR